MGTSYLAECKEILLVRSFYRCKMLGASKTPLTYLLEYEVCMIRYSNLVIVIER
jgi:hypothetical protein